MRASRIRTCNGRRAGSTKICAPVRLHFGARVGVVLRGDQRHQCGGELALRCARQFGAATAGSAALDAGMNLRKAIVELAVAERDREVAEVRSAVPLSDTDIERLREALSRATKKNVEVKVVIDPEVLGGIVTRMGDLVIDGTVRHRLDQLREQL